MLQVDIGDKTASAPDLVTVAVNPGDTIVVTNVAGDTLNTYGQIDGTAGTIASSANASFTAPVWVQSQGRTTVKLTGGLYGA